MTDSEGKEPHTSTLTPDAQVTCDGKVCKASDLMSGMRIRVSTRDDDPHAVNRVEALDKNPHFEEVGIAT